MLAALAVLGAGTTIVFGSILLGIAFLMWIPGWVWIALVALIVTLRIFNQ